MRRSLTAAALLLSTLALPVVAQESSPPLDFSVKTVRVNIHGQITYVPEYGVSEFTFIPQFLAWCASQHGSYGSGFRACFDESQIPPDKLRALRAAAGLPLDTPVWNGAKGEFVPLPPSK